MTLGGVRRLLRAAIGRRRTEVPAVPQVSDGLAAAAAHLSDRYPHWLIMGTDQHGLWASSREEDAPPIGCVMFLAAGTEAELEDALQEQETLRRQRGRR